MYTIVVASKPIDTCTGKLVWSVLLIILAVVTVEQFSLTELADSSQPKDGEPCQGEPLNVEYPYEGNMIAPHACSVQCEDKIWRHIVYTNDKATQCQQLPGCSDQGEDLGITCTLE